MSRRQLQRRDDADADAASEMKRSGLLCTVALQF